MNPAAYLEMAEVESRHWWFSGRREILSRTIASLHLPQNAKILEVGCGTGGNLHMLAKFGELSALELDDNARAIAAIKTNNLYDIRAGYCPYEINFPDQHFDLICMFDVLEHIEKDTETLAVLKRLLSVNGRILITVPAYQWLFGPHDVYLHHKRRYSISQLTTIVNTARLKPIRLTYFNTILFPLAALTRAVEKSFLKGKSTGNKIPHPIFNYLLSAIFSAEHHLLKRLNLPFGVSILCILEIEDICKKL